MARSFVGKRGLFHDNIATTGGVRVDKYRALTLDTILGNPRDVRFTRALRDSLTAQGLWVGTNTDPRWYVGSIPSNGWKDALGNDIPDPLLFRQRVSADTLKFLAIGDPVVLDFEKLTHTWQRVFFCGLPGSSIAGWRGTGGFLWNGGTNQGRPTAVTNYFHQDNPLKLYQDCDVALLDQLYDGAMNDTSPWEERGWVEQDAAAEAVDITKFVVLPVYDSLDYDPEELAPGAWLFNQDRVKELFT